MLNTSIKREIVTKTMKPKLFFPALVVLFSLLSGCDSGSGTASSSNSAASPTPANVFPKAEAEKLIQRLATQDGCQDSTADMRLSFTDADGKLQQMDFRLQRKYEAGKVSTLMTVISPLEESEKALLAVEEDGKPTSAISYLAGLKKVAQLKSDNPLNFRGSKSSVQEMLGMELGKYELKSINSLSQPGTRDGDWAMELIEKSGLNLSFPKIEVVFGGRSDVIRRFILYNSKDEKLKTIHAAEVKAIQNYQTITQMNIEDHRNKLNLKLETRSIKYDTNLPASLFTEANLIKNVTAASQKQIQ